MVREERAPPPMWGVARVRSEGDASHSSAASTSHLCPLGTFSRGSRHPISRIHQTQPQVREDGVPIAARILARPSRPLRRLVAGLPRESCTYTITPVRIPLGGDDGLELAADLYLPLWPPGSGEHPPAAQLLVHGPYGRGGVMAVVNASIFAARGYQVLLVSCRGTFGSGGQLDPGRTEAADGQAVVRWMRAQAWFPGSFATLGPSYLGYTQWALLRDPPPDLAAAAICVGPHDYARHFWGTGAFRLDRVGWSDSIIHQEDPRLKFPLRRLVHQLGAPKRLRPVLLGLPLLASLEAYFGAQAPWLARSLERPDMADEYYEPMRHAVALERVNVPVFLNTGWYDLFFVPTMEQYARLRDRGCDVELTIGPWAHVAAAGGSNMVDIFNWLEEHVGSRTDRHKKFPVRVFITGGAGRWVGLASWPPASVPSKFFLHPEEGLSQSEAPRPPSSFTYDPADPTPTVGGPAAVPRRLRRRQQARGALRRPCLHERAAGARR